GAAARSPAAPRRRGVLPGCEVFVHHEDSLENMCAVRDGGIVRIVAMPSWRNGPPTPSAVANPTGDPPETPVAFLLPQVANRLWLCAVRKLRIEKGPLFPARPLRRASGVLACPTTTSSFPSFPTRNSCSRCTTTSMTG